ncbi:hypothetical protein KC315_g19968, partial [Hortaea werneckii]
QDSGAQQQKPYDPFSHQAQPNQFDQYAQQAHPQQPSHAGFGGLSSAPTDYSSYYTSNEQRNAYNQYYGSSYGPQDVRSQAAQQDTMGPQRSTSGFGAAAPTESPYASQQQAQSRFGDAPGSGHTTPNPLMASQQQQVAQQTAAAQQAQQAQQSAMQAQASSHQQQAGGYGAGAGYPYGHPYYNSPYQAAYQNQFGFNH